MALASSARPIEGAVATLGVSDRVQFLRKTYAHLGVALIAFAAITAGMLMYMTETSLKFSAWALRGSWNWIMILVLFMVVGWVAEKLARSNTSKGLQYLGLVVAVTAQAILLQPMIWILMLKFGNPEQIFGSDGVRVIMSGQAASILLQAVVITLAIFIGLTLTVFLTKKDFSFMRGALAICSFAALGVILASMLFGFHLGAIFAGIMILLMAGYILYQTSLVMAHFPPTGYVAASLMLFSTIATLFWYVLQLLMSLNSRD
ncbi:MAG: Bax inhibitor-1 family protein [Deltaproteobacteria bacterium]|nr:Bax inhibitor-1 family protein [Deltaproteobacteria bacterium]